MQRCGQGLEKLQEMVQYPELVRLKGSIYQYEVSGGGHSYQNSERGLREVLVCQEQWPRV